MTETKQERLKKVPTGDLESDGLPCVPRRGPLTESVGAVTLPDCVRVVTLLQRQFVDGNIGDPTHERFRMRRILGAADKEEEDAA